MEKQAKITQIIDHLFRQESGRMVAILTRIFGPHNMELAEDVVQDALIKAIEQWSVNEIPKNPSAWLFQTAKNQAINLIKKEKNKEKYASDISHLFTSEWTFVPTIENLFSESEIKDDFLKMMFTCCHPAISPDSQVALTLKTLCGFGIPEISKAFLTTEDTINKRLVRARQKIREENIPFQVPEGDKLEPRLDAVLETIYLLFNEGYSASKGNNLIRYDLCQEAIRLVEIIIDHALIKNKSSAYALLALMLFNAARFKSRLNANDEIIEMSKQDRSMWETPFIIKGFYYFDKSSEKDSLSKYHILAAISACHCVSPSYSETNWNKILSLYDSLLLFDNSEIVLLNRSIALSKANGIEAGLEELEKIKNKPGINSYHLFYSTQAELFIQLNYFTKAIISLENAIALCPLTIEKDFLMKKLEFCKKQLS